MLQLEHKTIRILNFFESCNKGRLAPEQAIGLCLHANNLDTYLPKTLNDHLKNYNCRADFIEDIEDALYYATNNIFSNKYLDIPDESAKDTILNGIKELSRYELCGDIINNEIVPFPVIKMENGDYEYLSNIIFEIMGSINPQMAFTGDFYYGRIDISNYCPSFSDEIRSIAEVENSYKNAFYCGFDRIVKYGTQYYEFHKGMATGKSKIIEKI